MNGIKTPSSENSPSTCDGEGLVERIHREHLRKYIGDFSPPKDQCIPPGPVHSLTNQPSYRFGSGNGRAHPGVAVYILQSLHAAKSPGSNPTLGTTFGCKMIGSAFCFP